MKNLSKISDEKDIVTKEYVDPVLLDTTKTYTYAYFKSLADANRDVIIDGRKISRVWTNDLQADFDYMEEPSRTGNYSYLYSHNKWEHNETPLATLNDVIEEFANFVPTEINNQNNVGISIWTGNKSEYEAITTLEPNTLYLVMEQG